MLLGRTHLELGLDAATDDYKKLIERIPLGRDGLPEDCVGAVLLFASEAGSFITGQIINVDGGHGLRRGPDLSGMLEPLFGADGLRGVVTS